MRHFAEMPLFLFFQIRYLSLSLAVWELRGAGALWATCSVRPPAHLPLGKQFKPFILHHAAQRFSHINWEWRLADKK
jgi:hypothetical protein